MSYLQAGLGCLQPLQLGHHGRVGLRGGGGGGGLDHLRLRGGSGGGLQLVLKLLDRRQVLRHLCNK